MILHVPSFTSSSPLIHLTATGRATTKVAARALLLLTCSLIAACSTASGSAPRPNVWFDYQALWHADELTPQNGGFAQNIDDGALPRFRIRLRSASTRANSFPHPASQTPAADVEPGFIQPDAAAGVEILLGIATLDLPQASGEWFDSRRRYAGSARRWGAERLSVARNVALTVDLNLDSDSRAARLCRLVTVVVPGGMAGDRCTIEALLDREDGWPLAARIQRMLEAANGGRLLKSITFERLEPSAETTAAAAPATDQR